MKIGQFIRKNIESNTDEQKINKYKRKKSDPLKLRK